MTKKQLKHLEERLLEERGLALRALAHHDDREQFPIGEDDGELTSYPLHMADEGTDTMEQEKEMLLASKEGRLVYEIDEALRTLYKEPERYGECQECGGSIAFERLDVVPWTTHCIDCQERDEAKQAAE